MEISLGNLENMWYFKTHKKEYDAPGSCEATICSELDMKIDDYQNEMKKFHGGDHAFGVTYDIDDRGQIHSFWDIEEHAMAFSNKEDAQAALDWVEAQLLARKMSEDPSLIKYEVPISGHIWLPPTFITPKVTAKDLAQFKITTKELAELGKENVKCVSDLWQAKLDSHLRNTSEDTLPHKAMSSNISTTNVLLATSKPSMSPSQLEEMEPSLDLRVSLMKSRSSALTMDTSDSLPTLKKMFPMLVEHSKI